MSKLVSIIVPMHNEEGNVAALFARLGPVVADIKEQFGFRVEVIVNDNHSSDQTYATLIRLAEAHDAHAYDLRIFKFAKNIGFQKSILVGYRKARGDAVVQIDADLQDPPELILEFLRQWQKGYRVVYGVRGKRRESLFLRAARKVFYRFIDRISSDDLPHDSGDFRLVDRKLVDVICSLHDYAPYLRGLIASLGCKQIGVPYDRDRRVAGSSNFGMMDLIRLSMDGITNHSSAPLRFSSYFAFLTAIAMALFILFYLYRWMIYDDTIPAGFMTQTLLQLGGVGVLALFFAIQGAYISRIYSQLKEKPLAIVEDRILVEKEKQDREQESDIEVLWFGTEGQRSED